MPSPEEMLRLLERGRVEIACIEAVRAWLRKRDSEELSGLEKLIVEANKLCMPLDKFLEQILDGAIGTYKETSDEEIEQNRRRYVDSTMQITDSETAKAYMNDFLKLKGLQNE
jgi:hypothetical protein